MSQVENYIVNGTTLDNDKYSLLSVTKNHGNLKGANVIPAFDHGTKWRRKYMGEYIEGWVVYVYNNLTTTGLPPDTAEKQRAALNANFEEIMTILQTNHAASGYDAPLQVVRKMKSNSSSPTDIYRVNYGEMLGPVPIVREEGSDCYIFEANIVYSDPRWYESNSSGVKTASTLTASGNPGGTALMTRMTITLTDDDTSNPFIQNTTTGSKITWSGGNPSGNIVIDTYNYTATIGGTSVVGNIDRTGSTTTSWFELQPGVTNTLTSNVPFSISYTKAFL